MSKLDSVRTELHHRDERLEPVGPRSVVSFAVAVLLAVVVMAGAAEFHMFPTFSADDFGSILFGAG